MSASNSDQSESSQSGQESSRRYSRAGHTALQRAETELNRQRDKDRGNRYAATVQAQQDRAANAERLQRLSGRANEIEEVAALLSGSKDGDGGDRGQGSGTPPDRGEAREKAGGNGVRPSRAAPPATLRQAQDDLPDEDEDGESRSGDGPKALTDYAAERELDIDELYALTVTTDDGESHTLGELKDGAKKLRELDGREAEFEDQREQLWNEIAVKQQNIEALINRLKAYVPAETLARAAVEAEGDPEEMRSRAKAQLRQWFPEWKDNQVQQRDRERVESRLMAYGFTKFEVAALTDARVIRYLVETARKLDRYDRLRAMPRDRIPTTQAPSARAKPSRTTSTDDRARAQAEAGDKIGAIATLIGGK